MDLPVPDGQQKDKSFASHATMSKSFGLQRKTLARVIGLEKKVEAIEKNNVQLMDDYKDITNSIKTINDNLRGIQQVLQDDLTADEDAADAADSANRRQQDYVKKTKKEKGIENALMASVKKPLKSMTGKVNNIFGAFFKALGLIFGSWLLDKGAKMLDAWEKDPERFKNLRNEVLKALGIGGGIMLALSAGVGLLLTSMGGLIGSIVFGLPGILAVLANPLVWLGIGAVLGRYVQTMSDTEKIINDSVNEVGLEDTIAALEKERAEKTQLRKDTINPLQKISLGTEIAEIDKQLEALRLGYHGTGDPRYREMGLKNFVPRVPFLNDQYIQDTDAFKALVKMANEQQMSEAELKDVLKLINAYRQLSKDKNTAQMLQAQILSPPEGTSVADLQEKFEDVTNNISVNQKTIETVLQNEKIAKIDRELRLLFMGNTGESFLNNKQMNAMADLFMILYPKALPESFGNQIDNTRLFDQKSDNTILGSQSNNSTSDHNSLVASGNHGTDGNISHVSTNTNQNDSVTLASQPFKKGTTKVEVHPIAGENNEGGIVKGAGSLTDISEFALVNPLNSRYSDMYGAVYG